MRNFFEYLNFYRIAPFILNISITGAVVIVVVLIARLLLTRAPKIISYALWAAVLFRLLCPFSFESDLSVFTLFDSPVFDTEESVSYLEYIPVGIVHTAYPKVELPVPGVSDLINERLPSGDYQLAADPMEGDAALAAVLWMLGAAVMLGYAAISSVVLRARLIGSAKYEDNIRLTDHISTPFVFGFFRPTIYLSSSLSDGEREYIILHEKHHIRRGDHIWRMLAYIALSLHWFNPLVWAAFILSARDMEMSCDEAVIRRLGEDVRADYSKSLLELSAGRNRFLMTPPAFGEHDTKLRIKNIAGMKKMTGWIVVISALCGIVILFAMIANPKSYDEIIRVDGQYYIRYDGIGGDTLTELPKGSRELGVIRSVLHRSSEYPVEDLQAVNIDPKYAGCPVYRSSADHGLIYLYDYSGVYLPFAFTEDIRIRKAGGVVYDPTKITLTEAVTGQTYETENCLYMTPLSSYAAIDGDSGYRYTIGDGFLTSIYKADGSEYKKSALSGWMDFPWTDAEWNEMYTFGGVRFPSMRYEEMRVMEFDDGWWLMDMDGELWLVDINSHPNGTPYIWSIYTLVPYLE